MAGKIDPNALDLSNVASGIKAFPAGEYDMFMREFEITSIQNGDNAGKPMLKIQWKPDPEAHPAYAKRIIFDNVPVIPGDANGEGGTLWKVKQLTDALGFTDADYKRVDDKGVKVPFRLEQIGTKIGSKVRLRLAVRTYEGEEQNSVKRYKQPGDTPPGGGVEADAGMPSF